MANITVAVSNLTRSVQDASYGGDPMHNFMMSNPLLSDGAKPFIIPMAGLIIGGVLMQVWKASTVPKLILYFGAQSFMNIFMSWVMRTSVTVPAGTVIAASGYVLKENLTGCPAGFALTAMQQVVSFIVFMFFFAGAYFTPYRYMPKTLENGFQVFCVIIFGCVFALNIALNNFSLGYISIAVNLIIRSCLPLTTFLSQQVLATCNLYPRQPCRGLDIFLMTIGVVCAGAFTWARVAGDAAAAAAKVQSSGESASAAQARIAEFMLGVLMCIASLLCGSLNLALAGVLGETKLNVYDTVAYMAIPATVFLLPIVVFYQKPVPGEWSQVFGKSTMSDYEVLMGVWSLNKTTMLWLVLSGVLSFMYNIVQFSVVHTLSPSATAFGGNFNKAALIFLTLLLPFLRVHELPGSPYIQVIWSAVIINILAFSAYSYLQIQAKQQQDAHGHAHTKKLQEYSETEGSDAETEYDSEASNAKS